MEKSPFWRKPPSTNHHTNTKPKAIKRSVFIQIYDPVLLGLGYSQLMSYSPTSHIRKFPKGRVVQRSAQHTRWKFAIWIKTPKFRHLQTSYDDSGDPEFKAPFNTPELFLTKKSLGSNINTRIFYRST